MKKIFIIITILFSIYFLVSKYRLIKSDPCDVKCDNCVNPIQCEECYEDCYSTIK